MIQSVIASTFEHRFETAFFVNSKTDLYVLCYCKFICKSKWLKAIVSSQSENISILLESIIPATNMLNPIAADDLVVVHFEFSPAFSQVVLAGRLYPVIPVCLPAMKRSV